MIFVLLGDDVLGQEDGEERRDTDLQGAGAALVVILIGRRREVIAVAVHLVVRVLALPHARMNFSHFVLASAALGGGAAAAVRPRNRRRAHGFDQLAGAFRASVDRCRGRVGRQGAGVLADATRDLWFGFGFRGVGHGDGESDHGDEDLHCYFSLCS